MFFIDLTAVSMIEGMQNASWMGHMDEILKAIGNEKAQEHFKVRSYPTVQRVFIKNIEIHACFHK